MNITRHRMGLLRGAASVVGLLFLLVSPPGMPLSFGAETPAARKMPAGAPTTRPAERGVFKFKALTPVPASGTTKKELGVDRWLVAYRENTMFVFALDGGDRIVAVDAHTSVADGHVVTTYDGAKSTTWMTPPGIKRPANKSAALVQARLDAAVADIAAHGETAGTKGLNECATAAFKCYYMAHKARLSGAPDEIVEALIQCAEAVDVCLPSPGSQVAFNSVVILCTEEPNNPTCQELCSDTTYALESWCRPEPDDEPPSDDDTEDGEDQPDDTGDVAGGYQPSDGPDAFRPGTDPGWGFKYCTAEPSYVTITCSELIDEEGNVYGEQCTTWIHYELVCY